MREKKLREIEEMAATIRELATPGMSPKTLIDAVIQRYPKATKKEGARAAFISVIHSAEHGAGYTQELHDLAMETQGKLHVSVWSQCSDCHRFRGAASVLEP
ncbi:hypothetical protein [Pseudorhizobium pelagicum]|uniref:Uncharacterized protein n=1 Tax=Pseudorhizobium pelagicum TaxID=1509405 RepID=A0A922T5D1_9HYPH|nr:hypothetical protein [Pseudorhizobium pelagicum]KEQ02408.1 hypothetical protein GV67_20885 [Pseudorhizobium pelagicum]KEQ05825.1 hypothetical protein GV68_07935 [Pseudorhizobium pelagicum]